MKIKKEFSDSVWGTFDLKEDHGDRFPLKTSNNETFSIIFLILMHVWVEVYI